MRGEKWPAMVLTLLFLFNLYLHRISTFDFHPIALALPIFLWMLYFIERDRYVPVVILSLLAITIEETLIPPLVGVGIYIFLFRKRFRNVGLMIAFFAIIYFVLTLKIFMPFFLKENLLTHMYRYTNLGGGNLDEVFHSLLRNPLIFFRELVVPFEKVISLGKLFLSVGFLPLFAPQQLLLLALPISLVQVSNDPFQWNFKYQYSAISLPFLFFSSVYGLHHLQSIVFRIVLKRFPKPSLSGIIYLVKGFYLALALLIGYNFYHSPPYIRKWSKNHVEAIRDLLKEIPSTASVCANSNLVPHLINRYAISTFGNRGLTYGDPLPKNFDIRDAEYLLLDVKSQNPWITFPLSVEEYTQAVQEVYHLKAYRVLKERDGVVLFKRDSLNTLQTS